MYCAALQTKSKLETILFPLLRQGDSLFRPIHHDHGSIQIKASPISNKKEAEWFETISLKFQARPCLKYLAAMRPENLRTDLLQSAGLKLMHYGKNKLTICFKSILSVED
jgi:hypothetical protein